MTDRSTPSRARPTVSRTLPDLVIVSAAEALEPAGSSLRLAGSDGGAGAAPSYACLGDFGTGGSMTPCRGCSRTSMTMWPWIRSILLIS